ncbi:MAG: GAP family protein [Nocardioides sp.]|nr:GAP family protein [Nocardioides sp.]MDP3892451.1 GAP family protein [Nocardioides sp.]
MALAPEGDVRRVGGGEGAAGHGRIVPDPGRGAVPIWLMLSPGRIRAGRIVVFLATIATFYLLLGIALTAGASAFLDQLAAAADSAVILVPQLLAGVALIVVGLTIEPFTRAGKEARAARRAAREAEHGPGRLVRWRAKATDGTGSARSVMALAVTAAAVEVASMLPYLAAIGLLVTAELSIATSSAVLAGYCLVMVLPAVVLLVLRLTLHERISPLLARAEAWMARSSREAIAWVCFLLGLYLAAGAAAELGWIG